MRLKLEETNIFKDAIGSLSYATDDKSGSFHIYIYEKGMFLETRMSGNQATVHINIPKDKFTVFEVHELEYASFNIPFAGLKKFVSTSKKSSVMDIILDDSFTMTLTTGKNKNTMDIRLLPSDYTRILDWSTIPMPFVVKIPEEDFLNAVSIAGFAEGTVKFHNAKDGLSLTSTNDSFNRTVTSYVDYSDLDVDFKSEMELTHRETGETKIMPVPNTLDSKYDFEIVSALTNIFKNSELVDMRMSNKAPKPLILVKSIDDVVTTVIISEII